MIQISYLFLITVIAFIFILDKLLCSRPWFNPLNVFLFYIVLYVSPLTLRYIYDLPIEGSVTEYFYEIKDIYPFTLFYTSISLLLFYLAYKTSPIFKITRIISNKSSAIESNNINLRLGGLTLLIIGVTAFLTLSIQYGGPLGVILTGYAVTEIFSSNPMLAVSFSIISTSSICILLSYSRTKKKKDLIISLSIITINLLLLIVMGRRAEIATWGLAYIIAYSLLVKHISFKKIFPVIIIGFTFLNLLGFARKANYDSLAAFTNSFFEQFNNLNDDKSGMFYTLTTGQFVVPYETLPMVMEKMSSNEFKYGLTLFDIVTQWIPRGIWPEKGYGNGVWYYQTFYDAYALPNEGRQFFFLTEGYLNFGILGIFLWAMIWGIFWKNINYLGSNQRSGLGIYIYTIYIANLISLVPGDFVGMFVALPKNFLIWFFLAYLIAIITRKKRYV